MDQEQVISNMKQLIKKLSEENEELKTKLIQIEIEFSVYKNEYNSSMELAKKIIESSESLVTQYKDSISQLREAKKAYSDSLKEIEVIKTKYKKELKRLLKQI